MASFNKYNVFPKDLVGAKHDFTETTGNTIKVALTNHQPVVADTVYADITDLTTSGGYTAGGETVVTAITLSTATAKVAIALNTVWTATSGGFGPFQHAVLYNDTTADPVKPLIAWWDYGSAVTLAEGETYTVDFDSAAGIFTLV